MKYSKSVVLLAVTLFAFAAIADSSSDQSSKQKVATPTNVNVTVNTSATDTDKSAQSSQTQGAASAGAGAAAIAPSASSSSGAAADDAIPADKRLEAIKKVREQVENRNDDKVMEKLEKTRLDDEKQLSKNIDSTNLKSDSAAQPGQAAPAQNVTIEKVEVVQPVQSAQQPVVQTAPAPAPAPIAPPPQQQQAVVVAPPPPADAPKDKDVKPEERKDKWYVGITTGEIMYAGNLVQKSNVGVVVGKQVQDHLSIEGSFTYASFNLNNFWNGTINNLVFGTVDQYDLGAAVKYTLFDNSGSFHPYVGASADYILRNYGDRYDYGYVYSYDNAQSQSTNALNAGVLAGIDVNITSNFLIGGEFRYSMPIFFQDNGVVSYSYLESYAKPIEEQAFSSWMLDVKYKF